MSLAALVLPACKERIDWAKDVDYSGHFRIEDVASPLGFFTAKVSNFISLPEDGSIYQTSEGVYALRHHFDIKEKSITSPFDGQQLAGEGSETIHLFQEAPFMEEEVTKFENWYTDTKRKIDSIGAIPYVGETAKQHIIDSIKTVFRNEFHVDIDLTRNKPVFLGAYLLKSGHDKISLNFDKSITIGDVNKQEKGVRLDSAYFNHVKVNNLITQLNEFHFPWRVIKSIDVVLSDQFSTPDGRNMRIYTRGVDPISVFNTGLELNIRNFTLNLMKDRQAAPSWENVTNSASFSVKIEIEVGLNDTLVLGDTKPHDPTVRYTMNADFSGLGCVWGSFTKEKLADLQIPRQSFSLANTSDILARIADISLPVSEPTIHLNVKSTGIAAPLDIDVKNLYSISANKYHYATPRTIHYHVPLTHPMGMQYDTTVVFDRTAEGGEIHKLFESKLPDSICLDLNIDLDRKEHDMARVENNISIKADGDIDIPFRFAPGLYILYSDTIKETNLSFLNGDSISHYTGEMMKNIVNAEVELLYTATSEIQANLAANIKAYNSKNEVLMERKITIPAAMVGNPAKKEDVFRLTYEDAQELAKAKYFIFSIELSNPQMASELRPEHSIRMDLAFRLITAEAVYDLKNIFVKK